MNYIKQLNAAMFKIADDDRLNTSHVSVYLALFQLWNVNRFRNPLSINRAEVMKISKVGSKGTYHKCIKELHNWSYFEYKPSHNPLKGSKIYMFNFETTTRTTDEQLLGQVVVPSINSINNNKQNKLGEPPTLDEVKNFFKNDIEAEKFFNYYTSNGWKVGGKTPMQDWKASARKWMLKANEKPVVQNRDNLKVEQNKNYDEPL